MYKTHCLKAMLIMSFEIYLRIRIIYNFVVHRVIKFFEFTIKLTYSFLKIYHGFKSVPTDIMYSFAVIICNVTCVNFLIACMEN